MSPNFDRRALPLRRFGRRRSIRSEIRHRRLARGDNLLLIAGIR